MQLIDVVRDDDSLGVAPRAAADAVTRIDGLRTSVGGRAEVGVARVWQCLSAPASPPRSAPLPRPALVTKKLIALSGAEDEAIVEPAADAPVEVVAIGAAASEGALDGWELQAAMAAASGIDDHSQADERMCFSSLRHRQAPCIVVWQGRSVND